ncbi:MAG: hypothetical protein GY749_27475 [Desulfobacteraceae bacterium]|nr:hypothetical protein [Desulfobacteraceae bacterium]
MVETDEIIRLTRRINMELENFIPCVTSEIESKSVINKHLEKIQTLAREIQVTLGHMSEV